MQKDALVALLSCCMVRQARSGHSDLHFTGGDGNTRSALVVVGFPSGMNLAQCQLEFHELIEVDDVDAIYRRAKELGHEIAYDLTDEPFPDEIQTLRSAASKGRF